MRWLLCGLVFTALISLAVSTTALKASNVRSRKAIEEALGQASVRGIEHEFLLHRLRQATGRQKLAERLARHLKRNGAE